MQAAIQQMLEKYQCHSEQDYVNAIKEFFLELLSQLITSEGQIK